MIIWTIIRWLFVIIWWLFDSNYLWLFVIIWEMIICDYLMIIWYWLFVIIWSKLFVIIWWLFAILLLRSLSVASGWVDERRSCRGICCLLPFSAATISLSFWACLYCEQQTISEPWSYGESDTMSSEGLGVGACRCASFAAGRSTWSLAMNANQQLGGTLHSGLFPKACCGSKFK